MKAMKVIFLYNSKNINNQTVHIKKGDRIAQAVFAPFLRADNDNVTNTRTGGFGSTDK